jgi:hypothetical protein
MSGANMTAIRRGTPWCGRLVGLLAALLVAAGTTALAADDSPRDRGVAAAAGPLRLAEESRPASGAASDAAAPKAHIVSLGLWGLQNLFRTEANQAAAVLRTYYGRGGQVVVKANTRTAAVVTSAALRTALKGVSAQMDRERDLLVLVLTSHGTPEGIGIRTARHGELLSPGQLRQILGETGIANKVVILSACFSGIFTPLADAHTLVITAADATHSSFGCSDRANMTFFGELFFNGSVPERPSLTEAFAHARTQIRRLEEETCTDARMRDNGACFSNPQIAGGEAFAGTLRAASVSPAVKGNLQLAQSRQRFCRGAGLGTRVQACKRAG